MIVAAQVVVTGRWRTWVVGSPSVIAHLGAIERAATGSKTRTRLARARATAAVGSLTMRARRGPAICPASLVPDAARR